MSNEVQLIEKYRAASRTCTPNLTDSPVGVGLAALIGDQGIIEAIERLRESMEKHAHADHMQTRYLSGQ